MSLKDKENKSLQDKLKHYFKRTSAGGDNFKGRANFFISQEIERELSSATPINRRTKAIKDLTEVLLTNRLDEKGVSKLWVLTKDLLSPEQPKENRQITFNFVRLLIVAQYEQLDSMRALFFRFIKDHNLSEDNTMRFDLLQSLTENGKDIKCFEDEIGPFILDWMPQIQFPGQIQEFLGMVVNLVKFNAAYLDEDVVSGIVNNCCYLCCYSGVTQVVLNCLQVLEAIVSYAIFPHEALQTFVSALCRTVNVEQYCRTSWKIMRNVLGTDLGHAALLMMCDVLKDHTSDAGLTRGAVFYINMALWGGKRVATLKATHSSVLPSFLYALDGNQSVVTFEVILALQSLINKHGQELYEPAWDVLFTILLKIIGQVDAMQSPNQLIVSHLHETISTIEQLVETRKYNGNVCELYSLIDRCSSSRPEQSVLKLINNKAALITPTSHEWLTQLSLLTEKYARHDTRASIRTHMLHTLQTILQLHRHGYEEELLDRVVIPIMQHVALDADVGIRATSAKILIDMALHSHSKGCGELLDVLEKQLNRPFELYVTNEGISLPADADISDIRLVVTGLIKIFHSKLFKLSSAHAVKVYLILVKHLELHYSKPSLLQHHPDIRVKILEMFLSARANSYCQIGFKYDSTGNAVKGTSKGKSSFSPYVVVEGGLFSSPDSAKGTHSPINFQTQQNISYVSIRKACKLMIIVIKQERDWSVLQMVLKEIPSVMQNKALILSKANNDIDLLASALCSLVSSDKTSWSARVSVSEVTSTALAALACVAPYHTHLDSQTQQKIVKCLIKYGLVLRAPQQVISALTIFTLETRETMVKMLPEVLLELSKISDTCMIAGPILEFLSTLTRLPKVFASFVADQYMSVFAILLPYTNPSRYNHYIVSLAHHVIAAWFLKCRLSYRRDFVTFIILSLHNNIIKPFEEAKFKRSDMPHSLNEDSSNRMRSSSLGSRGREALVRPSLQSDTRRSTFAAFHLELTETCVDLMARYSFSPCSLKPRRSPTAEFMFAGGQSQTWLIGHKIVTITTSGCMQNSLKNGLCDRCVVLCKRHVESLQSPTLMGSASEINEGIKSNDEKFHAEIKRYTKYTLQHSRSIETSCSSLSDHSSLLPPSGLTTRQNSSENKSSDSGRPISPKVVTESSDGQTQQINIKLEKLAHQFSGNSDEHQKAHSWSRVWGLMSGASGSSGENSRSSGTVPSLSGGVIGQCTCWCSGWAEVYVRRPTGDVAWVMRMQNQMNFDSMMESPLSDIESILAPSMQPGSMTFNGSTSFTDSRNDINISDCDPRSRSGSASSTRVSDSQELIKSQSDSRVQPPITIANSNATKNAGTTEPIDIPGSPQRQSSSSTTTDEDLDVPIKQEKGKTRHPVRRSNSSPEMSSSWKNPFHLREMIDSSNDAKNETTEGSDVEDHTAKNGNVSENGSASPASQQQQQQGGQKKACKKAELRVSCEAIPEEMCTTPPHPHLMTYNSDPGTAPAAPLQQSKAAVSSDTALDSLLSHSNASSHNVKPVTVNSVITTTAISTSTATNVIVNATANNTTAHNSPPTTNVNTVPVQAAATEKIVQKTVTTNEDTNKGKPPASPGRSKNVPRFVEDLPPLGRSKRSNTISVMSPMKKRRDGLSREWTVRSGGGVTPAFVLLQLYHHTDVALHPTGSGVPSERPLLVSGVQHERTIKNLDLVPSSETYKIGVLYVGPSQQDNEIAILKNEFGSLRYAEFVHDLGTLIAIEDADKHGLFLNVEKGGKDGTFTYVWQDDIMQVQFHVATLMPNNAADPTCNEKRKHIGNDYVSIVYNDSGADFNIHTIKGQFNFCIVLIEPLEHGINRVSIKSKDERIQSKFLGQPEPKVISDQNVALLARQLALHCTLASLISCSLNVSEANPYASNSLERLRIIKRLRTRLLSEKSSSSSESHSLYSNSHNDITRLMDDFTEYTSS